MNLIQIQDRLKQLPQDPRTMQLLASYANGANPNVPPYLALAEIQRRNKEEQSGKAVEPPQGTVKDREEAEALKQSANLMAAQQAQQQQGIQQLQSQLAQNEGEVAPGTPQPQGQEIPQPMQAAEGGIMRLPVKDNMFNFDSGGIVAFAGGDVVDYKAKAAEYLDKKPNLPKTYMETMEEAKLKNPELAKPAGQEAQRQIQELQRQDEANRAKFDEREEAARRQSFWDSLIAAGEATRGQDGIGALMGGFGRSSSAARAAADERRARQEALQREQQMNVIKMNAEIENLRRAEARGDVAEQQKSLAKISEIQNAMDSAKANLGVNLGQLGVQEAQQAEARRHNIAAEALQGQQIGATRSLYAPEVQKNYEFLKRLYPDLTTDQLLEKSMGMTKQAISNEGKLTTAQMVQIEKIEKEFFPQIMAAGNDPKKLEEVERRKQERINQVKGGIAGLPQPSQQTPQGGGGWGKAERVGA